MFLNVSGFFYEQRIKIGTLVGLIHTNNKKALYTFKNKFQLI